MQKSHKVKIHDLEKENNELKHKLEEQGKTDREMNGYKEEFMKM